MGFAHKGVPRAANKDVQDLLIKARDQGFQIDRAGSGHLRIRAPNGTLIFETGSRLDPWGFRSFKARMKRAGYKG